MDTDEILTRHKGGTSQAFYLDLSVDHHKAFQTLFASELLFVTRNLPIVTKSTPPF